MLPTSDSNPTAPGPLLPIPADSLTLTPTIANVALRGAPGLDAPLLCRLGEQTPLRSLEPAGQTSAKLGQPDQWIHVQSLDGEQGYIAAWYAQLAEAFGANCARPEGESSSLPAVLLSVTEDGLALRSAPQIDETTLLTRLPLGATLTALDEDAAQKAGLEGAWVHVRAEDGRVGYVAAWYVKVAA